MNFSKIFLYPFKYIEQFTTFIIVFVLTPSFFMFEMSVVRPKIIELYDIGPFKHYVHVFLSTICFINVAGNLLMSILTNPRLMRSHNEGEYCASCNVCRPTGSWHCSRCNVCIVRRDHHCFFLSRCIGLDNLRYYILYLGHMMLSMVYSFYYNYYFVSSLYTDGGMYISALRIINPLVRYMIPRPMDARDFFVLILFLNVGIFIWASFLFTSHMKNVLKGLTSYESKANQGNLANWRVNIEKVFGERWILAMIFPFVVSRLPEKCKLQ